MEGVIGEIRLWAASFEPYYWAFCDGRLMRIADATALFAILGTMYGGDGRNTFALPDLRGRVPVGAGQAPGLPYYAQGQVGGVERAAITAGHLPAHGHLLRANSQAGDVAVPTGAYPAKSNVNQIYGSTGGAVMSGTLAGTAGASVKHPNMMPYTCCNYIICVNGYFPSREW